MQDESRTSFGSYALYIIAAFVGAWYVSTQLIRRNASETPEIDARVKRLIAAADTHPDPSISGEFAHKLRDGEIAIQLQTMSYAVAEFGRTSDRRGLLIIDPKYVTASVNQAGMEDLWVILSHEHEHYLQWLEDGKGYAGAIAPFKDSACTFALAMEVDAHAVACRDARRYGWKDDMGNCRLSSMAEVAKYKLKDWLVFNPECEKTWRFFAGPDDAPLAPALKLDLTPTPRVTPR